MRLALAVQHIPDAGSHGEMRGSPAPELGTQWTRGLGGHLPLVLRGTNLGEERVQRQTLFLKCLNEKGVLLGFELFFRAVHDFFMGRIKFCTSSEH